MLLTVGSVLSIMNLRSLGKQIETFCDGPFIVNNSANIVNTNFERMQKEVYRAISNSDPDINDEAITAARESAAMIKEQLPVIEKHFLGDKQIIERLDTAFSELEPMREYVLTLAGANKGAEAAAYMENNNIPVIEKAQTELDLLIESGNAKGIALVGGLQKGCSQQL